MANINALHTYDVMESIQIQLDTFLFSAETGINVKEACDLILPKALELFSSLENFESGEASRDGHAKQASADIRTKVAHFVRDLKEGGDIKSSGTSLRDGLAIARRTYMSRDSMVRMSSI